VGKGVRRQYAYKRPFDLAVVVAAHVLLLPVWVLIWTIVPALIWLDDRGPIFFRQARLGLDGRVFYLFKFRSMVRDAEKIGAGWTGDNDSRVTRIGKLLRRTGLDEVPQVINIIRGDIGLVGPRALPVRMHKEAMKIEPRFAERLQVRPGGAGLALLRAPRHCSPRRRLRYDLIYIDRAGFWLDVKILILSAWLTLTGKWGTGFRKPEEDPGK